MLNPHFDHLPESYLFPLVQSKVSKYQEENPNAKIIRLGIGDVTLPLIPAVVNALKDAAEEMGSPAGFKGYGPENGYLNLRQKIAEYDYPNLNISCDEIFVSDGSKCDVANIQELFSDTCRVGLADPTYPIYLESNIIGGRAGIQSSQGRYSNIIYFDCVEQNNFAPTPPHNIHCDIIYLCSPNNPTGMAMSFEDLEKWVEYARTHRALILYDGAYTDFIQNPDMPRSIYEIPGAKEVAIEFRSYSKRAGFTGLRCAYTVVPTGLIYPDLNKLWKRRQSCKFNGVSYPIQKAAEAIYSAQGFTQTKEQISYYMENAKLLRQGFSKIGLTCYGGIDAPFIWAKLPPENNSWEYFDHLLQKYQIVVTPGKGFGSCGEGFIRISSFSSRSAVEEAIQRIQK